MSVLNRIELGPKFTWSDQAYLAFISRLTPKRRWRAFLVTPDTLVRLNRSLVKARHRRKSRTGSWPRAPRPVRELVIRLAEENPRWGYRRVSGGVTKLGIRIQKTTVLRFMRSAGLAPVPRRGPTWKELLVAEANAIIATDFFTVDAIAFRTYYVLFFIEHQAKRIHLASVTRHSTGARVAQHPRDLFGFSAFIQPWHRHLIRDRDSKFIGVFDGVSRTKDFDVIKTSVRAPKTNAIARRDVGTIRRDLLDLVIVPIRRHLQTLLAEYIEHYNSARPHRGLDHGVPDGPSAIEELANPADLSRARRRSRCGGLVHESELAA